jgi:hypothetical protein
VATGHNLSGPFGPVALNLANDAVKEHKMRKALARRAKNKWLISIFCAAYKRFAYFVFPRSFNTIALAGKRRRVASKEIDYEYCVMDRSMAARASISMGWLH